MTITELDSKCTQGMNEQLLLLLPLPTTLLILIIIIMIIIIIIISFFTHGNHIHYILHVNVSVLELMCGWLYSLVSGKGS